MTTFKTILGYSAAVLSLLITLVTMAAWMFEWGQAFADRTGLVLVPTYSGGEVVRTVDHGAYQTEIHRPIFDALIGETKEGFIQVAWRKADALPAQINEAIDFDADGQADFHVSLDTATRQATLTPLTQNVLGLKGVYSLGETLAIRVTLRNPKW
jgi:hypothetical protein